MITSSLDILPSVPGPEYFDDGWKKVTNAPELLNSHFCPKPKGDSILKKPDSTSPYPSKSMQAGGKVYFPERSWIGLVHPAKSMLPCACT